jgi:hypothetical protein
MVVKTRNETKKIVVWISVISIVIVVIVGLLVIPITPQEYTFEGGDTIPNGIDIIGSTQANIIFDEDLDSNVLRSEIIGDTEAEIIFSVKPIQKLEFDIKIAYLRYEAYMILGEGGGSGYSWDIYFKEQTTGIEVLYIDSVYHRSSSYLIPFNQWVHIMYILDLETDTCEVTINQEFTIDSIQSSSNRDLSDIRELSFSLKWIGDTIGRIDFSIDNIVFE